MHFVEKDWDRLEKGDYLTQADVERITGKNREDDFEKFSLALLGLKGEIERNLTNAGKNYTVKIRNCGIEILSDPKALQANAKDFRSGLRRSYKAHRRLNGIDLTKLDEDERRHLEAEQNIQSRVIIAIEREASTVKIELDTPDKPSLSLEGDTLRISSEKQD